MLKGGEVVLPQGLLVGEDHQTLPGDLLIVAGEVLHAHVDAALLQTTGEVTADPACQMGVLGVVVVVLSGQAGSVEVVARGIEPGGPAFPGCRRFPAQGKPELLTQFLVKRTGKNGIAVFRGPAHFHRVVGADLPRGDGGEAPGDAVLQQRRDIKAAVIEPAEHLLDAQLIQKVIPDQIVIPFLCVDACLHFQSGEIVIALAVPVLQVGVHILEHEVFLFSGFVPVDRAGDRGGDVLLIEMHVRTVHLKIGAEAPGFKVQDLVRLPGDFVQHLDLRIGAGGHGGHSLHVDPVEIDDAFLLRASGVKAVAVLFAAGEEIPVWCAGDLVLREEHVLPEHPAAGGNGRGVSAVCVGGDLELIVSRLQHITTSHVRPAGHVPGIPTEGHRIAFAGPDQGGLFKGAEGDQRLFQVVWAIGVIG